MEEVIRARGHSNVRSRHRTTLEVTKESHLTPQGDCIIAVSADKAMEDFPVDFRRRLRDDNAVLEVQVECNGVVDKITARGAAGLLLEHPTDLVVRKSDYIDGRTLAVKADKAAADLSKMLVSELKKDQPVKVTLKLK